MLSLYFSDEPKATSTSGKVEHIDIIQTDDHGEYLDRDTWSISNHKSIRRWKYSVPKAVQTLDYLLLYNHLCRNILNRYESFITNTNKWDLVVVDACFPLCTSIIVQLTKSPYILLSATFPLPSLLRHRRYPNQISGHYTETARFNFRSLGDRIWYSMAAGIRDPITGPIVRYVARYHFGHQLLSRNFSWKQFDQWPELILSLYPSAIDLPRPRVSDLVTTGDINCVTIFGHNSNRVALSEDIADFVDDTGSKGTVIASFGHLTNWSVIDNRTGQILYDAFRQLSEYRFIWQYNGYNLPNSSNVMLLKWIPQASLLRHPRTKALITHCGTKTFIESICAGVPMVAVPLSPEHQYSAHVLVRSNLSTYWDIFNPKIDSILSSISEVLSDDGGNSYKASVVKMAQLMSDQPLDQQQLGVHWINFVMRHRDHMEILKPRRLTLGLVQLWSLDVIGAVLLAICFIVVSFYNAFKLCVWLLFFITKR